jgi:hypothetical protein
MSEFLPSSGQFWAKQASAAIALKSVSSTSNIVRVTPAQVGNVTLPFPCPICNLVRPEVVDSKTAAKYVDATSNICPACNGRYVLVPGGSVHTVVGH